MTDANDPSEKPSKATTGSRRTNPRTPAARIIKGLPRIRWAEDTVEEAELAVAKDSAFYWLWVF